MRKSSTSKSTIRNDPFASVIPLSVELDVPSPTPEASAPKVKRPDATSPPHVVNTDQPRRVEPVAPAPKSGKQKLTVHLDAQLADRVKNAAYWEPRLTIAGIAERGIRSVIEKIEREHGGVYPPREGELVGGRPIK